MAIHPSNIAPAHAMRSDGERVKSQLGMGVGESKKVCIKIILIFFLRHNLRQIVLHRHRLLNEVRIMTRAIRPFSVLVYSSPRYLLRSFFVAVKMQD